MKNLSVDNEFGTEMELSIQTQRRREHRDKRREDIRTNFLGFLCVLCASALSTQPRPHLELSPSPKEIAQ
jgi:hypothetical protein